MNVSAWVFIIIAGVFEICWVILLKQSHGLSKLWPTIFTLASMLLSTLFLSFALKTLPIGICYAVWTGIGIVGSTLLGTFFFDRKLSIPTLIFILIVCIGIAGIKLTETAE